MDETNKKKSRRHWTQAEKLKLIESTFQPGITVSSVARGADIAVSQLFGWVRMYKKLGLRKPEENQEIYETKLLQAEIKIMQLEKLISFKNLEIKKLSELVESAQHQSGIRKINWFT